MNRWRVHHLSRRRLLGRAAIGVALMGGAPLVGCGRFASSGERTQRIHRIGVLTSGSRTGGPENPAANSLAENFLPSLNALGYVEGRNLAVEWRFSEGVNDRLGAYAADLVRLPVAIVVAIGAIAVQAAMTATSRLPIVMAPAQDPIESGFVASFARPGANVTGVASLGNPLATKRLQLLKQALPALARLDVLYPATPALLTQLHAVEAEAHALQVQVRRLVASTPGELDAVLGESPPAATDALMALSAPFINSSQARVLAWAAARRAPVSAEGRAWATGGALLTYGRDQNEVYERAAIIVDKILKGANPADTPVELPTRFELVINLKTAAALGLAIPPAVVAQASEVIK
jgi:putative tryptophan/tyrosine transport system substrate-binding protein